MLIHANAISLIVGALFRKWNILCVNDFSLAKRKISSIPLSHDILIWYWVFKPNALHRTNEDTFYRRQDGAVGLEHSSDVRAMKILMSTQSRMLFHKKHKNYRFSFSKKKKKYHEYISKNTIQNSSVCFLLGLDRSYTCRRIIAKAFRITPLYVKSDPSYKMMWCNCKNFPKQTQSPMHCWSWMMITTSISALI